MRIHPRNFLITVFFLALCLLAILILLQNNMVRAKDAKEYVGERATVCGFVTDTYYSSQSNGSPTFLNFVYPYPKHAFTAVIWERDREGFSEAPEDFYLNKDVCVTGLITVFNGIPQITVKGPEQIAIQ